jgi:predicted ATP-dependent endonuclease of OLD family
MPFGEAAMRLKTLKLKNFRSYRDEVNIPIDRFTAVVGKNDIGKSTVLEAMEVFFNSQVVKIDPSDACVGGETKIVEIRCVFDELPITLTLDARSETTLRTEWLLNRDGDLEIVKQYDCKLKTPKESVFAYAFTSDDARVVDLLQIKNDALKRRAEELGCDLEGVDKRSNAALRAAIRARVGDVGRAEALVPLNEEDGKKVWEQIVHVLPAFALFQSDRSSKDDDPEVADPMKIAVANAVKDVEAELDEIKERVRQSAIEVAQRTLAKLQELDPALAQQLTPSFRAEPKWDGFKLSLAGDDDIPINKRGSGVRRLILLSFFRAEAERRRTATASRRVIYAIEEPESSQHPNNQILLIKALLALSEDPNTQVVITTHVPGIAAMVPAESVRLVSKPGESTEVQVGDENVLEQVANALGVFPDRRAKVAIFVEGPNDVEFLTRAAQLHRGADPTVIDVGSDCRIVFIPAGGGNLQHWVNGRYLRNAGLTEVHIYDTDDQAAPKYKQHIDAVNARGNNDIGFLTTKRELENYIHATAVEAEFNFTIAIDDWCDVPDLVAEQVHIAGGGQTAWGALADDAKGKKVLNAKRRLNRGAMDRMTLADLLARDAGGDILIWLRAVEARAN